MISIRFLRLHAIKESRVTYLLSPCGLYRNDYANYVKLLCLTVVFVGNLNLAI